MSVKEVERTAETDAKWDVNDVAAFLGVSKSTVWRWHDSGFLPAGKRIGTKTIRWDPASIRDWWSQQPDAHS